MIAQTSIPVTTVDYWSIIIDEGVSTRDDGVFTLANGAANSWVTNVMPQLDTGIASTTCDFLDMQGADGTSGTVPAVGSGGQATASTPPGVCIIINKLAPGTRSQRNGRYFLPGGNEVDLSDAGIWTPAKLTLYQNAIEAHVAAVKALTIPGLLPPLNHVMASWARLDPNGLPWPPGTVVVGTSRPITGYSARSVYGSQRDRRP